MNSDHNDINNGSNNNNNNAFICGVVEGFYGRPWTCDQRKDLFKRLKQLNLNSFMYAPKDDLKHRPKWRQLYSQEESNELKALIDEAKANGIDFYYSLAPGLDMIYSDRKDLDLLVKKYDQIVGLGCESFAILFDDIEPSIINETDRRLFSNYASAQVSVTNLLFEHLKRPKFMFCPTEYCESRAVPSVTNSTYLGTIGTGLIESIDIMWSGSRVVSQLITEESIETLTKVIRRPPVIWENLHANDYDKKRVFLGPYSGRSTKIIPKLRGILTNPNCEYEANYIAIHTLAQWSRCSEDINLHNRCNPKPARKLPSNSPQRTSVEQSKPKEEENGKIDHVYDPNRALSFAIKDWLHVILEEKLLPGRNDRVASEGHGNSGEIAGQQLSKDTTDPERQPECCNSIEMLPDENTQSSSSTSASTNRSEMDTSSSPAPQTTANLMETNDGDSYDERLNMSADKLETMRLNNAPFCPRFRHCFGCWVCHGNGFGSYFINQPENVINNESLAILVDLLYLPFEHGFWGQTILEEIKWLRDNSDKISKETLDCKQQAPINRALTKNDGEDDINIQETKMSEDEDEISGIIELWLNRAQNLDKLCDFICQLVHYMCLFCPNRMLFMELNPYLISVQNLAEILRKWLHFIRSRNSSIEGFCFPASFWCKESASSDEQEPWYHRGGLMGDVQRLLCN